MLLMLMMTGATRLLGELEKDKALGTGSVPDLFSSKLLAGQGGVLQLESRGSFLVLPFSTKVACKIDDL